MKLRQAMKIVRAYNREAQRAHESGDTPHYRHNIGQWAKASMYINRIRLHLSFMAHFDDGQPDRRSIRRMEGGQGRESAIHKLQRTT